MFLALHKSLNFIEEDGKKIKLTFSFLSYRVIKEGSRLNGTCKMIGGEELELECERDCKYNGRLYS